MYPSSTGSNSTTDSNDADTQPLDDSAHLNGTISSSASKPPISLSTSKSQNGGNKHSVQHKVGGTSASSKGNSGGLSDVVRDISRGFNNAQPPPINIGPLPNQEHRCKYPGCNQVSTCFIYVVCVLKFYCNILPFTLYMYNAPS